MNIHFQFELDQKQKIEWTEFWQNCKHSHAQQHEKFGEVERAKGRIPVYVYGENEGKLTGIAIFSILPLFFGKRYSLEAICAGGPAFDDITHFEDFLLKIISYFKKLHVGSIRIAPYWFYPESEEVDSILKKVGFMPYNPIPNFVNRIRGKKNIPTRSSTALIDIQPNEDEIFSSFSRHHRWMINRANKCNIQIRPAKNLTEAIRFFKHVKKMFKERGVMLHYSLKGFKGLYNNILKDNNHGILLSVYSEKVFLGGIYLTKGPKIATAVNMVFLRKPLAELSLSNISIGPIIMWKGMLWAKEKGCHFLDLGGSAEDVDKSSPEYRIRKYKQAFNPINSQLVRQHSYKCNSFADSLFEIQKFWKTGSRISNKFFHQIFK